MKHKLIFVAASTVLAAGLWVSLSAWAQTQEVAESVADNGVLATDNAILGRWIEAAADRPAEGGGGAWQFVAGGRQLVVLTDEGADRMRLMTPVANEADLDPRLMEVLMRANFDRALDARYAVRGDVLWSVYIHPLSPLQEDQFDSAVDQVVTLADNFGTTFASSDMVFGDPFEGVDPEEAAPAEPRPIL